MSTEPSLTVYTEFESDAREYVARLLDHASELFAAVQSVTIINVETEAKRVERADEAASAVTLIGSERGAAIFKLDPVEALALNYEASKDPRLADAELWEIIERQRRWHLFPGPAHRRVSAATMTPRFGAAMLSGRFGIGPWSTAPRSSQADKTIRLTGGQRTMEAIAPIAYWALTAASAVRLVRAGYIIGTIGRD
ncbi:hypothetical protein [Bradyrhizobium sp. BTAi1]|uniref:hypothetical protein n=1 Tax=Bradyrhizobium sp. (strain BTAi1 / ATCC BAA-1182) TaxID=288000 RepID=UPI00005DE0F4|nr:hypothetical protein [Bradyrhizobium sp. BTAi1]ABQ36243.1 hypothetical protein BBta_4184 [Bradyrhizobium sp. BTAi1]